MVIFYHFLFPCGSGSGPDFFEAVSSFFGGSVRDPVFSRELDTDPLFVLGSYPDLLNFHPYSQPWWQQDLDSGQDFFSGRIRFVSRYDSDPVFVSV